MSKNEQSPMDNDSLKYLEQVRHGKPRNFVLGIKGSNIGSLLVKKKSVKDKERTEARKGGYSAFWGVATGTGGKITFVLARSDGFDEPPGGSVLPNLKGYLKDQAGKPFSPSFDIADTPPAIPFDEDDLDNPLIAKFMKLEPVIVRALETKPDEEPEIARRTNEIRGLLQDEETNDRAEALINEFVIYLKQLLKGAAPAAAPAEASGPPPAPAQPAASADESKLAAKLAEGLKKLKPLVEKVINADPNRKGEMLATIGQIAGEIKGKQFAQARENMLAFGTQLKGLLAQQSAAAAGAAADEDVALAERRAALEPRLKQARQLDREKATALANVWDYALTQAQAGNFANAGKALDRLEQAVEGILRQQPAAGGTIAQKTVAEWMLKWKAAKQRASADLEKLYSSFAELLDDEDAVALRTAVRAKIEELQDQLDRGLDDAFDDLINAGPEQQPEAFQKVARTAGQLLETVESNELLRELDSYPFGVDANIAAQLTAALGEVAAGSRG